MNNVCINGVLKNKVKIIFVFLILFIICISISFYLIKRQTISVLNILNIEAQLDSLVQKIGSPVFINRSENSGNIENIFILPNDYFQVITDQYGKVIVFSITAKNQKSELAQMLKNGSIDIYETKIDNSSKPDKCFVKLGNTGKSFYVQQYYSGRPGKYLYFLIGYNDASELGSMPMVNNSENNDTDCKTQLDLNSANTLMISKVPFSELSFGFGTDKNQLLYLHN